MKWQEYIEKPVSNEDKQKWEKLYPNGDTGFITGPISRLFVLDDDGSVDLKRYNIPRTATVKTPKGGKHYYFKWHESLNNKVTTKTGILEKVDVRGYGGFVRFYGWEVSPVRAPLANPPQWLIDLLPDKGESRKIETGPAALLQSIKEGNRNDSFARLAGGLRNAGYSAEAMFEALKFKAKEVNFPEEELMAVCRSIERYPVPLSVIDNSQGENIESFLANRQEVKWICEPFIAEESIGFIAGLPESRKSWILIDLAVSCATGGLWLNKFPVEQSRVLLIDQERSKGECQRRIQAVIAGKGLSVGSLRSTLFVRSGTSTRIDEQSSSEALNREISLIQPSVILIDSFATFHTKNEINRQEIQIVMERIKEIRNEFKCSVILIHHETKSSYQNHKEGGESSYLDMSGNVAIPAAAEFCMNIVKRDEETSWCHHTKNTQGLKTAPFLVKVRDMDEEKSKISVEAF